MPLPDQAEFQIDLTVTQPFGTGIRRERRGAECAGVRIRKVIVGNREMRRVGDVGNLRSEYELDLFGEGVLLDHADVGDVYGEAFQRVHRAGAVASGAGRRNSERRRIEPGGQGPRAGVGVAYAIRQLGDEALAGVGGVGSGEQRRVVLAGSEKLFGRVGTWLFSEGLDTIDGNALALGDLLAAVNVAVTGGRIRGRDAEGQQVGRPAHTVDEDRPRLELAGDLVKELDPRPALPRGGSRP